MKNRMEEKYDYTHEPMKSKEMEFQNTQKKIRSTKSEWTNEICGKVDFFFTRLGIKYNSSNFRSLYQC